MKRTMDSVDGPAAKAAKVDTSATEEVLSKYNDEGRLDRSQLDESAILALHRLGSDGTVTALERFCAYDLSSIENPCEHLKEIASAVALELGVSLEDADQGTTVAGEAAHKVPVTPGVPLGPQQATEVLKDYSDRGLMDISQLDDKVKRQLGDLSREVLIRVLDVFVTSNLTKVSNPNGFLINIVKLAEKDPGLTQVGAPLPANVQEQLDKAIAKGSIGRDECDPVLLATLSSLDPSVAVQVLQEFMNNNPANIHNKAAFLGGIIKRYRYGAGATGAAALIPGHSVEAILEHHYTAGVLQRDTFDSDIIGDLHRLPPGGAAQAIDEFIASDKSKVRNPPGFMKVIIRNIGLYGVSYEYQMAASGTPSFAGKGQKGGVATWAAGPVGQLLESYYAAGSIARDLFDKAIVEVILALPYDLAVQALAEFTAADRQGMRNVNGFMKGIINRLSGNATAGGPPYNIGMPAGTASYGMPSSQWSTPNSYGAPTGGGMGSGGSYGGRGGYGGQSYGAPSYGAPAPSYGGGSYGGGSYGGGSYGGGSYGGPYQNSDAKGGKGGKGSFGKGYGGGAPMGGGVAPSLGLGLGKGLGKGGKGEDHVFCPACGFGQPRINFCTKCGYSLAHV